MTDKKMKYVFVALVFELIGRGSVTLATGDYKDVSEYEAYGKAMDEALKLIQVENGVSMRLLLKGIKSIPYE